MWYVVQVFTGREEKIKETCLRQIKPDVLERCFIPYYEEQKKYMGKWHQEKEVLFPGYVFMVTDHVHRLYEALKGIRQFSRILGDTECLSHLNECEVAFLEKFGGAEQVVEMSSGVIEGEQVWITSGPLMGMEGCIRKIDRHKRRAWIQVEMFGKVIDAAVGLEIVAKR